MDREKFNKIPVWIDKNLTKTYMDRQKIPVWIDKELSAIVEGDLLSPILPSATIDKRNLHKVAHGKNMKTPNWGKP